MEPKQNDNQQTSSNKEISAVVSHVKNNHPLKKHSKPHLNNLMLALKKLHKNSRHSLKVAKIFLFAENVEDSGYSLKAEQELRQQIWQPVLFGLVVTAVAFAIFGLWGTTAPLDSAAVAGGVVVSSSNRQTVQSYEGGVISKIVIKEGDKVEANQELLILNPSQNEANLNVVLAQLRSVAAIEARLLAEQRELEKIDFYQTGYLNSNDPEAQSIIAGQQKLFESRRDNLNDTIRVATQRILQRTEVLKGLQQQLHTVEQQVASEREKLRDIENLYNKGLATKPATLEVKRIYQEYENKRLSLQTEIMKVEQEIIEAQVHKTHAKNEFDMKIAEEYKSVHAQLLELEHKYKHAKELLDRTIIKAPVAGTVTGLRYHTVGGVISPGATVMDITPADDDLVVDAYVSPIEVNHLRLDMEVKVQLNPYKARLVPRIPGKVIYVSADRIINEHPQARAMGGMQSPSMESYFLVKIKISKSELQKLNADVKLFPGMPVTVFLIRGTRTFLHYLLDPILDSFHKSFKEQ